MKFKCTEVASTYYGQRVKMRIKINLDFDKSEDKDLLRHDGTIKFNIERSSLDFNKFEAGKVYEANFTPIND